MVNTAESDIVSPSVTAEYPLGFLCKEVFFLEQLCSFRTSASACFQSSYQLVCSSAVFRTDVKGIQIFLSRSLHVLIVSAFRQLLHFYFQTVSDGILSKQHTIAELCVILEQGVRPCRSSSVGIYGIWCRR